MYGPGSNPVRLQCATLTPLATLNRQSTSNGLLTLNYLDSQYLLRIAIILYIMYGKGYQLRIEIILALEYP